MTIKSKNRICEESKIVFNKIEIYTSKKIQYFCLDDVGKYQLLVLYFDKKGIIWKKSTFYTQNQDKAAECFIYIIIEKTCTMLIYTSLPSEL